MAQLKEGSFIDDLLDEWEISDGEDFLEAGNNLSASWRKGTGIEAYSEIAGVGSRHYANARPPRTHLCVFAERFYAVSSAEERLTPPNSTYYHLVR